MNQKHTSDETFERRKKERKKEITLFNEGKDIDYWSPSSFHNGPPTIKVIKHIG